MKFFGWKAAGGGPARPALSRFAAWPGAALGEWPISYEAQARDGYLRNPVAQRAVRLVAEGVASAPLTASDPTLAALVTARSGGQALLEALATHLLLHGNAYVQVLTDSEGAVVELFALRPERVGGGRWRLATLWRGRRGTEWAIGRQRAGDRFVLIEADAVTTADLPVAALGGQAIVLASGLADPDPVQVPVAINGASVLPPAPVHLTATTQDDGSTAISWVRRSRQGWHWIDGVDAPLVEESERYRMTVRTPDGAVGSVDTVAPALTLSAGACPTGSQLAVAQIGNAGASRPTIITHE